jgi:hypothetical protein
MKKLAILALSVFVVASMSTAVMANDVVAAFDATGTQGEGPVFQFVPFDVFVIGQEIGNVTGWELAFALSNPQFTVLNRIVNNGPGVNPLGDATNNFLIGLGACYGTAGASDYLFVTYNMGFFVPPPATVPFDSTFCIIPPNGGNPPASGFLAYTSCANQITEMTLGNLGCSPSTEGCAVLNPSAPCVVATEQASWGAVKAAF